MNIEKSVDKIVSFFDIGKNALIVTDKDMLVQVKPFLQKLKEKTNADKFVTGKTGRHGSEPEKEVSEKMNNYEYVFLLTKFSMTHTDAVRHAIENNIWVASMPNFSLDMVDALDINYDKIFKEGKQIAGLIEDREIRIKSKTGTKLELAVERKVISPSKGGPLNLPMGEVFTAPLDVRGQLVVDGGEFRGEKIKIDNNKIIDVPRPLLKELSVKNGQQVAEFGIGLNEKAFLTGNTLMDEKVRGTCHIAFGDNISFGGNNTSEVHLDLLVNKPTVVASNKKIMKNGNPLW